MENSGYKNDERWRAGGRFGVQAGVNILFQYSATIRDILIVLARIIQQPNAECSAQV